MEESRSLHSLQRDLSLQRSHDTNSISEIASHTICSQRSQFFLYRSSIVRSASLKHIFTIHAGSQRKRYMENDEIWYTIWSWTFSEIAASHKEFVPITRQIQLGRLSTYGLQYRKRFTSIQYSKGATAGTPFTQNHTTCSRSRRIIFKTLGLNRETEETKAQF